MQQGSTSVFRHRSPIAESWSRAVACGLKPTTIRYAADTSVDQESLFARITDPIVERLRESMAGERVALMMTDRSARLIKTAYGEKSLSADLDSIGGYIGTTWSEELTGTNALATPFATRKPIFVHGDEHYIVPMKQFSCYGAPIIDPVTGRCEGVLDLMMDATAESRLIVPIVDHAVEEIRRELHRSRSHSSQELASEFVKVTGRTDQPVVALHPDVVMTNPRAAALLAPEDIEALRELLPSSSRTATVELSDGSRVRVSAEWAGPSGAVFRLRASDRAAIPRSARTTNLLEQVDGQIAAARAHSGTIVVVGERGTGRTTAARRILKGSRFAEVDAATDGADVVEAAILAHRTEPEAEGLLIENCDRLPDHLAELVTADGHTRPSRIVATYCSSSTARDGGLPSRFDHRVHLPALREMLDALPAIVRLLSGLDAGHRFDGGALKSMTDYDWPDNLAELNAVLTDLEPIAAKRTIRFSDVPLHIRRATAKNLTPWQRASRGAVIEALQMHDDNKSHAAEYLGISRSSLYHHIRQFGL